MENKNDSTLLIAFEAMFNNNIAVFKGQKIMTVENVAVIYEVVPEYLQKQVDKNAERFPEDFIIGLTNREQNSLKTAYKFVFTEKGILMAGGVLKSKKAIKVHIQMVRHFVRLYKENEKSIAINDGNEVEPFFKILKQLSK
jgi:hypothetical protein